MMPYINKENTLEAINKLKSGGVFSEAIKTAAIKTIENQPAADVVEVKHGYWKRQKGRPEAICSECGREVVYQTIDNKWWFENYCPHCGADMRKKEGRNNANEKM